jgi:glucokinase
MSYAIGIDLGGTNIKFGLADHSGNILFESIRPTYLQGSSVYDNIGNSISEVKAFAASRELDIAGIGIGVPAIVDNGLVTGCFTNLPELEGMALGSRLEEQTGIPVWVDNDANLMGLAEWKYGAARGVSDAIFLTVGTGVGGAMVLNGQLYAGFRGRGAELGHIVVQAEGGYPCGCGGRGCLEAHASVKALIEDYLGNPHPVLSEDISGSLIVARYQAGEPAALLVMNRHFDWLAAGVAGLINIFSPQMVIIGGGISESGEFYIREVSSRALARAMKETSVNTVIKAAQLGNKAGFLGAAGLVFTGAESRP